MHTIQYHVFIADSPGISQTFRRDLDFTLPVTVKLHKVPDFCRDAFGDRRAKLPSMLEANCRKVRLAIKSQ